MLINARTTKQFLVLAFFIGCIDSTEKKSTPTAPAAPAQSSAVILQGCPELRWTVGESEILREATVSGKPILFFFKSVNCVNCWKMESEVFSQEAVKEASEKFVLAAAIVDDSESLLTVDDGVRLSDGSSNRALQKTLAEQISPENSGNLGTSIPLMVKARVRQDEFEVVDYSVGTKPVSEVLAFLNAD